MSKEDNMKGLITKYAAHHKKAKKIINNSNAYVLFEYLMDDSLMKAKKEDRNLSLTVGKPSITKETGLKNKAIINAYKLLKGYGLITVKSSKDGNRNTYTINHTYYNNLMDCINTLNDDTKEDQFCISFQSKDEDRLKELGYKELYGSNCELAYTSALTPFITTNITHTLPSQKGMATESKEDTLPSQKGMATESKGNTLPSQKSMGILPDNNERSIEEQKEWKEFINLKVSGLYKEEEEKQLPESQKIKEIVEYFTDQWAFGKEGKFSEMQRDLIGIMRYFEIMRIDGYLYKDPELLKHLFPELIQDSDGKWYRSRAMERRAARRILQSNQTTK